MFVNFKRCDMVPN